MILSPAEVGRLLEDDAAPPLVVEQLLPFSYRVIFSTMYGTGVRVSEALHLRVPHLDSQRMMIRIEQGKGHRDRYVPFSPKLLEAAHLLAKTTTATLAVPRTVSPPASEPRGRPRCHRGGQRARWSDQACDVALASPRLRRAPTGSRNRPPQNPTSARSSQSLYHGPLSPSGHHHGVRHHQPLRSAPHR